LGKVKGVYHVAMGTHSLIFFQRKCGDIIRTYAIVYQQLDGFPDVVGLDLAEFLSYTPIDYHGMGALAAQFIADKQNIIYLYPFEDEEKEEFNYYVIAEDGKIKIKIEQDGKESKEMTPKEFKKYCTNKEWWS